MKRLLILGALVIAVSSAHAESRDPSSPYTPQQLKEMSTRVFEGTVMEVETNTEHKVSFPTKATVSTVLKGKRDAKVLTFKHKHPGKHIILEKEYNTPEVGQAGTFYIEDQGGTLVLIGYIKKTEPTSAGDVLRNLEDLKGALRAAQGEQGGKGGLWQDMPPPPVLPHAPSASRPSPSPPASGPLRGERGGVRGRREQRPFLPPSHSPT